MERPLDFFTVSDARGCICRPVSTTARIHRCMQPRTQGRDSEREGFRAKSTPNPLTTKEFPKFPFTAPGAPLNAPSRPSIHSCGPWAPAALYCIFEELQLLH